MSATDSELRREASLVLDELSLPMRFVDLGGVTVAAEPLAGRHLAAELALHRPTGLTDIVTVICRLLSVPLVHRVTFDRSDHWGTPVLAVSCSYGLSRGDWTIELAIRQPETLHER